MTTSKFTFMTSRRVKKFSGIKELPFLNLRSKVVQNNEETQNMAIVINKKRLEL